MLNSRSRGLGSSPGHVFVFFGKTLKLSLCLTPPTTQLYKWLPAKSGLLGNIITLRVVKSIFFFHIVYGSISSEVMTLLLLISVA